MNRTCTDEFSVPGREWSHHKTPGKSWNKLGQPHVLLHLNNNGNYVQEILEWNNLIVRV